MRLDRAGRFKARVSAWGVKPSQQSQSIAIHLDFIVTAAWNGSEWESWEEYEPQTVSGDFYVVKKDGQINTTTVDQLAASIGWAGNLELSGVEPPDVEVQITAKEESFQARSGETMTVVKASWIDPGDFVPAANVADAGTEKALNQQFGSLLRAAAAGKVAPKTAKGHAKKTPTAAVLEPGDTNDLPF